MSGDVFEHHRKEGARQLHRKELMLYDQPTPGPRKRYRDDGTHWDKINKCYMGTISLGFTPDGKCVRRTVHGKTRAEVKDNLAKAHDGSANLRRRGGAAAGR
jgi:hypothetical protein